MSGAITLSARVVWQPRSDLGRWVSKRVVPGAVAGATAWATAVKDRAAELAPEGEGDDVGGHLKDTGKVVVSVTETRVVGRVVFASPHAGFVEFGTGRRGAAGGGGKNYSADWPGMPAQPYLRPSVDEVGRQGKDFIKREVTL